MVQPDSQSHDFRPTPLGANTRCCANFIRSHEHSPKSYLNPTSTLNQEIAFWEEEQRLKMLVPSRFDPNLVSEGFINSLALNNFARANWIKFLDRKRKFQSPEDLLSIWRMDTTWFEFNRDSIYISEFNDKPSEEIRSKKFYFEVQKLYFHNRKIQV